MKDTKQQFEHVIAICRDLFAKKLHDYGAAWRIMRPSSVTDQIFIKANRIRSIETKGVAMVDEGIRSEFIAIVNYGIIGLVQLELGYAETDDMTEERALVKGYAFQIEMKFTAYKCGFKIVEVPVIFINRELGTSKMNSSIFGEAVFGVIKLKMHSWFHKYPQAVKNN